MPPAEPYQARIAPAAWRSLKRLPARVHSGIIDFTTGRLATDPRRIGYRLGPPFDGQHSAHYGAEYRVRYEIDEDNHAIVILRFDHRSSAYGR